MNPPDRDLLLLLRFFRRHLHIETNTVSVVVVGTSVETLVIPLV